MIHFKDFKKSYGQTTVLSIPQLDLEPGIFWVKGVNGSGKSTLLKSMAGMLSCNGDIVINGETSLKSDPVNYRKKVNFSEAEPLFPPFITGIDLVDLFRSAKNGSVTQCKELLASMKMGDYIANQVNSYSSGMLKKLSLLLAFIGNPSIILLDEPLITIDVESLHILYSWMANEHEKNHTTFLITSHQQLDPDKLPVVKALTVASGTLSK
ncbi:ABC-2 type transport system ATP-binding protein [Pedobacter sp. UYP24]